MNPIYGKTCLLDTNIFLIATAKIFGIEVIITADEDFQRVKDISVYNPFKTV